ncbi:MAG: DUF2225 domain-containing protein [Bacillota bacterium]
MDDLFLKNLNCLACKNDFQSSKVRRSKYSVIKVDTDFCTYYRGENPLFYNTNICPHCGYGFTENFRTPGEKAREAIANQISPFSLDFSGRRNLDLAVLANKRAVECAQLQNEKDILKASLYLQVAWFYRIEGDEEAEKIYLEEARHFYSEAFEKDKEITNIGRVLYLLGDLNRRLGNDKEAIFYLGRVINDKTINDPGIIRMARERWQDIRED